MPKMSGVRAAEGAAYAAEQAVLVTIRVSHYCEKARWALDRGGVPYREDAHLPMLHYLPVRRAGGVRTTPVLRVGDLVLADSTDILRQVDDVGRAAPLFPDEPGLAEQVARLEDRLDEEYGPHVRRVMYYHLLPDRALTLETAGAGVVPWERTMLPALYPLIRFGITKGLRLTPDGERRSVAKVDRMLDEVSALLADGRPYLLGGRFTAADLTFAALTAPLVSPPEHPVTMPPDERLPGALRQHLERWRATAAARHALAMYARHRGERV